MNLAALVAREFPKLLDILVGESTASLVVLANHDGIILDCNEGFRTAINTDDETRSQKLCNYLNEASWQSVFSQASYHGPLSFVNDIGSVIKIDCHVAKTSDRILIVGNRPYLFESDSLNVMTKLNMEMGNLARELQRKNRALEQAQREIKRLGGLVPICSNCKSIRNDDGFWQGLEMYLSQQTGAEFSHGVCDDCVRKLYPDIADAVLSDMRD